MSEPQVMAQAPTRRPGSWFAFGVLFPALAFAFDASLHIDPVLWGTVGFGGRSMDVGARQAIGYWLLGASMLGLVLLSTTRSRAARTVALPLLGLGVVLAALHAVVFVPFLPLSFVGIMAMGIGLLGFTPYAALFVYVQALSVAVREQRADCDGRPWRWIGLPLLASLLPVVVTVAPYLHARGVVERMRQGDAAAISRGFRELGHLAPLVQGELSAIYLELPGPSQARMRNLFLERFGRDVHSDLGRGRLR